MNYSINLKTLVVFLFLTLLAPSARVAAQNRDWAKMSRYAKSDSIIMSQPNDDKRVVFMGNSITDGWYRVHPNFFKDNGYIGRGIGGQTSFQYLVRFRQDVIKLHPAIVVINAGTNDIAENTQAYNQDYTMDNIKSMVELAKAHGIYVILTSTLPSNNYFWNKNVKDVPAKIMSLNRRIRLYAKRHHIPFVNYYKSLVEKPSLAFIPALTKDGVHPNAKGYDVMEKIIKKHVDRAFKHLEKKGAKKGAK